MLLQRVITAVVLLIIIIGALLISPLAFTAVAAIAIGCCFWEWLRICKWNNGVAMVCGVLLAGPDEHSVVQDLSDPSWQEDRTALENHEIAFADMLILRGLVLRTDLLGLISNFCTPEFETKRYDTFFFSALMPEGQVADGETSEAQIADWVTPAYAMRAGDAGNWLAPTVYNLTCIASAQNAKEFVETRRRLTRFMSYPIKKEDGTFMLHCDFPKRK